MNKELKNALKRILAMNSIVVSIANYSAIRKYKLSKGKESKPLIIIKKPDIQFINEYKLKYKKLKKEKDERIDFFIERLTTVTSQDNLKIMHSNLRDLYIKHDLLLILANLKNNFKLFFHKSEKNNRKGYIISGGYHIKSNFISLNTETEKKLITKLFGNKIDNLKLYYHFIDNIAIYHELLHMSSSKYQNRIYYSGFSQSILLSEIGINLNEGYTQHLTNKYFSLETKSSAYMYYVIVARIIESIIGESKMESMYFQADLYSLVKELSKYSSRTKTEKFILGLDNLTHNSKNPEIYHEHLKQYLKIIHFNKYQDQNTNKLIQFDAELENLDKCFNNNFLHTEIHNNTKSH